MAHRELSQSGFDPWEHDQGIIENLGGGQVGGVADNHWVESE